MLPGITLRLQGKRQKARTFLLTWLGQHPNDQRAYLELYHCADSTTTPELIQYFKSLPALTMPVRDLMLSWLYLRQGDITSAVSMNNQIIKKQADSTIALAAELNNFYIDLYNKGDINSASALLTQLKTQKNKLPLEEINLAEHALQMFGVSTNNSSSSGEASSIGIIEEMVSNPVSFGISQNYPNPFNPTTTISYQLANNSHVRLTVWNMLGQRVATLVDENEQRGVHHVTFDASQLASGIYLYRLQTGGKVFVKKMLLMK